MGEICTQMEPWAEEVAVEVYPAADSSQRRAGDVRRAGGHGNTSVDRQKRSYHVHFPDERARAGGVVERLMVYSPLANAMTDNCAAIRLSDPCAACW